MFELTSINNYLSNKKHGVQQLYHAGKLLVLSNYENGMHEGQFISWNLNGKIAYKLNLHNDKYHGECLAWHDNGNLLYDYKFKNGRKHELCRSWNTDGVLIEDDYYNYGVNSSDVEVHDIISMSWRDTLLIE